MAQQKEFGKTVVITIEENGDSVFLATDSADVFLEAGETITRRASHVEPVNLFLRVAFHFLRLFGNKNQIAAWTRGWPCLWRINTKPVGGPVLTWNDIDICPWSRVIATFRNRQAAIDAEVQFLNRWFAERG
jgi:hypothetical protein